MGFIRSSDTGLRQAVRSKGKPFLRVSREDEPMVGTTDPASLGYLADRLEDEASYANPNAAIRIRKHAAAARGLARILKAGGPPKNIGPMP